MGSTTLIPLWSFVLASLITVWSLGQRQRTRTFSLLLIWLLNLLSLKTCGHLTLPGGFNSTFAGLIIFSFLHTLKILLLDYQPPRSSAFVDSYKLWNNPRGLQAHPPLSNRDFSKSRLRFALQQSLKVILLFTADTYLVQGVVSTAVFTGAKPDDFSPYYELLLFQPLTGKQVLIRAAISVSWIWTAFYLLEASHCLLSLVFVGVLRWDEADEWPSVWGHLGNATSIRGFWGKVWNRITILTFAFYAKFILTAFGLDQGSGLAKILIPFLIFFISGLSHSLGGWAVGDAALGRDVLFFMLNFLACAGETWVGKTRSWKNFKRGVPTWVMKTAGAVYLFGFFFMVVPLWMYPKIYGALGL
ncbi:hypothetical protein B0T21DRAFT_286940 [Apiosordaria backusii]|uniref:Wax synthase domain-containing protein n=1 Tax=Apiosordaria backusii TaxID=314023 RepID=A0AA40BMX9_9PEZI|nr:hypothetical protein B0T21DRAFT_286940 [Apiosordaria backusii]